MSEMDERHIQAAQHIQRRLVMALANDEAITPELVRTWLDAVKVERESMDSGLGFDPIGITDEVIAELDDDELERVGSLVRKERARRRKR